MRLDRRRAQPHSGSQCCDCVRSLPDREQRIAQSQSRNERIRTQVQRRLVRLRSLGRVSTSGQRFR